MDTTAPLTPEVRSLIEAVCDGIADDAQMRAARSLLRTDESARIFCVDLLNLNAELHWLVGSLEAGKAAAQEIIAPAEIPPQHAFRGFQSNILDAPQAYLSSGWPIAYLAATLIVGIGLTVMAFVPMHSQRFANREERGIEPQQAATARDEIVGRVTGMVDCVWVAGSEDKLPSPACESAAGREGGLNRSNALRFPIRLGDRFDIRSGLLEITYETGAKVILQGPVTYDVESTSRRLFGHWKTDGTIGERQ